MVIKIRGASEHNLKNIDVDIGAGLTVVTGVSGSGKTSLVFDTLYHEARRRFLDVYSISRPGGWQRQLVPAQVESISGMGPAIAVGQNLLNRNPHSTLASASGLHPFLRLLYTHYGERHCASCGAPLSMLTEDEAIERIHRLASQGTIQVYAPLLNRVVGSHRTLLDLLTTEFGAGALLVDGSPWHSTPLDPRQPHNLEITLGRLDPSSSVAQVREVAGWAAALGSHALGIKSQDADHLLATAPVCTQCGTWFGDLEPRHFHMDCPFCKNGCDRCDGTRMHPLAAGTRWEGHRFPGLLAKSVAEVCELFTRAQLPSTAERLRAEIQHRLDALARVGLGYLSLERPSPTLSRGESQRVRLAIALTCRLEDMLHVLDEPTIGQHPADVARFLPAFRELAGPVVYVEHDRVAASVADRAIDLGPGAGQEGGEIVFAGPPKDLWRAPTPTGQYFSLQRRVTTPEARPRADQVLSVQGAHRHNLQQIDVSIPIGRLTVITGVSGSGKSTLVEHVLIPSLQKGKPHGCQSLAGPKLKPVLVDQSPIGRNPRSNPATYTKLSDIVRELYAGVTGLSASHFSFNRSEGACPACKGMGAVEVKMQYLYSTWIRCADCDGLRFNDEVLAATVPFGTMVLSIADFYQRSIGEVAALFAETDRIPAGCLRPAQITAAQRILRALTDVGLGYLPLGQPSPTLSGGEAQRVKLTKYLGRGQLGDRLLVLDEPSTGLHPQDLAGLLVVLDRLVRAGATIVVVEHNTDVIRAADWVLDLGPGAGPAGGQVLYAGPPGGLEDVPVSATGRALSEESEVSRVIESPREAEARLAAPTISIRNARANNLKGVHVDFPKGKFTVVTGLSGSGKSSLVSDVLEAEARRRYLESLSMYERQGTREGPEAPVDSVSGLGVTLSVGGLQAHQWSALTHFTRRASVGRASELSHHLAILLANLGERMCLACGAAMIRSGRGTGEWRCTNCDATAPVAQPRHFSTSSYASACNECTGVGILLQPQPEKLIVRPDKPLCGGAMHSPGYWPQSYLCKDTGFAQALGALYGFDPAATPWNEMSEEAQQAFLFGTDKRITRTYRSKSHGKLVTTTSSWEGFYGGWVRDWDVHGTYTSQVACPSCGGAGLRPEYLAVRLARHNVHDLSEMPLDRLARVLENLTLPSGAAPAVTRSFETARRRLRFLCRVGLGYLNLNRPTGTLSAGEAQRIQLASILGSGLTSLTLLLDEPSRGMHPSELEALREVLVELRDEGNTVIVVEHDLLLIRAADHVIDMGPGAGVGGGEVVAEGPPHEIARSDSFTARWLRAGVDAAPAPQPGAPQGTDALQPETGLLAQGNGRRAPAGWLVIKGARENNLRGETVRIPRGVLVGVCGVSGSGKSTLLIDTLGRALVRRTHSSSFSREPVDPGAHDAIEGAPSRALHVDQARRGIHSPAAFLGLTNPLLELYAESEDAQALGLDAKDLKRPCSACKGRGLNRIEMGFLPDVYVTCETCQGTGFLPEAWQVRLQGFPLPRINSLTLAEVYDLFTHEEKIAKSLRLAQDVGLGYLVWRQPSFTLSGGEVQRLKIVKELARFEGDKRSVETLYILDEPTVGQHMEDVQRLMQVLHRLVAAGHTVIIIEHHSHALAACDWLIELGPGGGPDGGRVIAAGTPEVVAASGSPSAPYLRAVLKAARYEPGANGSPRQRRAR